MCRSCNSSKNQRTMSEWFKSASLQVVEYWRDRIPPVGKWDPDFVFKQKRRLIPIVYKPQEQDFKLLVRLKTGEGAVIFKSQLDSPKFKVVLLGSGKIKLVTSDDVIDAVKLEDMLFDLKKLFVRPPSEPLSIYRGVRVDVLSGVHAGKIAVVEYADRNRDEVQLSLGVVRFSLPFSSVQKSSKARLELLRRGRQLSSTLLVQ